MNLQKYIKNIIGLTAYTGLFAVEAYRLTHADKQDAVPSKKAAQVTVMNNDTAKKAQAAALDYVMGAGF